MADTVRDAGRFAWARLNADTLFVALLAVLAGVFDVLDPADDAAARAVLAETGVPGTLFYVRCATWIAAGTLLFAALLRSSLPLEVLARAVLIGGVALNVWRHGYWLGWGAAAAFQMALLFLVVLVTTLRLSVLLGARSLVVTRPSAEGRQ